MTLTAEELEILNWYETTLLMVSAPKIDLGTTLFSTVALEISQKGDFTNIKEVKSGIRNLLLIDQSGANIPYEYPAGSAANAIEVTMEHFEQEARIFAGKEFAKFKAVYDRVMNHSRRREHTRFIQEYLSQHARNVNGFASSPTFSIEEACRMASRRILLLRHHFKS